MSDETLVLPLISLCAPTLRLGAGLENGTNAGQSGPESGRRGLPPADELPSKIRCRCLGLFQAVLKRVAVNRRVAGSNPK